jgi:hypothetical protein
MRGSHLVYLFSLSVKAYLGRIFGFWQTGESKKRRMCREKESKAYVKVAFTLVADTVPKRTITSCVYQWRRP